MKKVIFKIATIVAVFTAVLFIGCQSPSKKAEEAQEDVQKAKENLKEEQQEAQEAAMKAANAEEWKMFKTETQAKIDANEKRIAELRDKKKKSGKTMDAVYEKNIDLLEQRNKDLKARMDNYETNQSDWAAFKREFNHDMDELGAALRDFGTDNKK